MDIKQKDNIDLRVVVEKDGLRRINHTINDGLRQWVGSTCDDSICISPENIPAVCAALLDCDEVVAFKHSDPDHAVVYRMMPCKSSKPPEPEPHVMCPECCDSPLRRIESLESDPSKKRYVFFCGHEFEMVEDKPEPESDWAKIRDLNEDTLCTDKPDPYAEPEFEFEWEGDFYKIVDAGDCFYAFHRCKNDKVFVRDFHPPQSKDFIAKYSRWIQARLAWRKQEEWRCV